jgi:hypothetical protein
MGMMIRLCNSKIQFKHCWFSQIEEFISDCKAMGFDIRVKEWKTLLNATDNVKINYSTALSISNEEAILVDLLKKRQIDRTAEQLRKMQEKGKGTVSLSPHTIMLLTLHFKEIDIAGLRASEHLDTSVLTQTQYSKFLRRLLWAFCSKHHLDDAFRILKKMDIGVDNAVDNWISTRALAYFFRQCADQRPPNQYHLTNFLGSCWNEAHRN